MPVAADLKRTPLLRDTASRLRVKVCCIASIEEAAMAIDAGADALGLVSAMPSGPGVIADADITTIAQWIGARAASVLLTSRQSVGAIEAQLDEHQPDVLQIVDAISDGELALLRVRHPDLVLMPVVHVTGPDSIGEATRLAANADAILLDSGNPLAAVKELGGTGRVHDWQLSCAIRESLGVPLFLAGGLRRENVAEAVALVQPFGVDVCSGVRREGRLDRDLLSAFIAEARSAS